MPAFNDVYPEISVRLRMSDRNVDLTREGVDIAFHFGNLADSAVRLTNIAEHLRSGALVPVATRTPPTSAQLSCLYPHKRFLDPKIHRFFDFMVNKCKSQLKERDSLFQLPR